MGQDTKELHEPQVFPAGFEPNHCGDIAPIDVEVSAFIDDVAKSNSFSTEVSRRIVGVATQLVGWSSGDRGADGYVPVAELSLDELDDRIVDTQIMGFLAGCSNIHPARQGAATDAAYVYIQLRKNGMIREVTLERTIRDDQTVVYRLRYTDLVDVNCGSDKLLRLGKLWLASIADAKIPGQKVIGLGAGALKCVLPFLDNK